MDKSAKLTGSRILQDRTSLKAYVAGNNQAFNQKIGGITKKDFTKIKNLGIFEHSNSPNPHIFYYHASKYNSNDQSDLQEFITEELHRFYHNFQCSYSIAYIHSNFVDFIVFRRFVEKWPQHFFQKLRKIYIIGPSIMVKIIQKLSFGTFSRLCDQFFLNIGDVSQLKDHDTATMSIIGQIPKTTATASLSNGVKIIENGIYGKILQDYELSMSKYPIIILRLLKKLIQNPIELQLQGIFRKSCDTQQLEKLQRQLQVKNWNALDSQYDILIICGCLKKLLNNLKLPLFNYKIYNKVINFQGGDQIIFVKSIIEQMEYVNQKMFILLLTFLKDFVISQQMQNKMSGYNLSVVFGPCFFRPKQYDIKDLIYSGKFVKILVNCFEKTSLIFAQDEIQFARSIISSLNNGNIAFNQI